MNGELSTQESRKFQKFLKLDDKEFTIRLLLVKGFQMLLLQVSLIVAFAGTPADLVRATYTNNVPEIDRLCRQNPNLINTPDSDGSYPITAAGVCNDETLRTLLFYGADISLKNRRHAATALDYAALNDNWINYRILRDAGAKHTVRSAAMVGDLDALSELIENDEGSVNNHFREYTVVALAALKGQHEVIDFLGKKGANVNASGDRYGLTPLHFASSRECVKRLVAHDAEVHARNAIGEMPIHSAARHGRIDVVQQLIAVGSDPNPLAEKPSPTTYANARSLTPLEIAAGRDSKIAIVRLLLKHDPDGDTINRALWTACFQSQVENAKLLLEHGADADYGRIRNMKPLMYAVRLENVRLVKLLVEHGASMDDWPNNPLDYAKAMNFTEIVEIMESHQKRRKQNN